MKVEELQVWHPTTRWWELRKRVLDSLTHEQRRRMLREVEPVTQPNGQPEL